MGCKPKTRLLDLLESHTGGNVLERIVQPKPATLPSTQVSQTNLTHKKRKQDQKGKEVIEERKTSHLRKSRPREGASKLGSCRQGPPMTNKLKSQPECPP